MILAISTKLACVGVMYTIMYCRQKKNTLNYIFNTYTNVDYVYGPHYNIYSLSSNDFQCPRSNYQNMMTNNELFVKHWIKIVYWNSVL
jgi:hypothetical protein